MTAVDAEIMCTSILYMVAPHSLFLISNNLEQLVLIATTYFVSCTAVEQLPGLTSKLAPCAGM